jgi:integrase
MSVVLREKSIDKNKVSLYLDIYHNKKRSYEFLNIHIHSKRLSNEDKEKKEIAEKIRSQREYELLVKENGLTDKKKSQAGVTVYLDRLSKEGVNSEGYLRVMSRIKDYCNDKHPITFNDLTVEWLLAFQKWMLGYMMHNSAVSMMSALKTALNRAVEEKIIRINPMNDIPKSQRIRNKQTKRTHLEIEELEKLAKAETKNIHPQVKQGYLFSAFCGMRWSDISPLKWADISIKQVNGKETWVINFQQEKTEDIEYLPLSEQAVYILKERKAQAKEIKDKSPYVFPAFMGQGPTDEKNSYSWVTRQLKLWAGQAKIEKNITFHTGRHTFATMTLDQGVDLYTVSKLLGHREIKTTTIYAKVSDQRKYEAVNKIPMLNLSNDKQANQEKGKEKAKEMIKMKDEKKKSPKKTAQTKKK